MNFAKKVWATERALAIAGVSVRQFCFRAGISPITWRMWRRGDNMPQMRKWLQCEAVLGSIQEEHRAARKARRLARQKAAIQAMKPQP